MSAYSSEISVAAATSATAPEPCRNVTSGAWRVLSALAQLGFMQFVVAAGSLVRNKAMAVYMKPQGFGEFTQIIAITAPVYAIVQCGMAVGLSRNTAVAQNRDEQQRELHTANALTTGLAVFAAVLLITVMLSPVSGRVLPALGIHQGATEKAIVIALIAMAPIEALRTNFLAFLEGLLDVKGLSAKRSTAIVLSTAVAVPLIAFLQITGAAIQTIFASIVIVLLLGSRIKGLGFRPLRARWNKHVAVSLMTLGFASLVIGFAQTSTDAFIRAHLISSAGVAANGLYQAAVSVSTFVTSIVLGSVGVYSLATLSQTADTTLLQARLEELARVVLPVAAIGLGAVGLLSGPIFTILFARGFGAGTEYLPLLLVANYVQVATWVLGAPVLGRRLVPFWIGIQLTDFAVRYAIATRLLPIFGVQAVALAFMTGMILDLIGYALVCKYIIGASLPPRIVLTFLSGCLVIGIAASAGSMRIHMGWRISAATLLCFVTAAMGWPELRSLGRFAVRRYGGR